MEKQIIASEVNDDNDKVLNSQVVEIRQNK